MFGLFFILSILVALFKVLVQKKNLTESLLKYILVINCGLSGLYGFTGHYFMSDMVADSIGWPAGNPFQLEVAFTNLAYGILGLLSLWSNVGFRIASAIGYSTFLLGAAIVHIRDINMNNNLASGNAGIILYFDILIPILLLTLCYMEFKKLNKRSTTSLT